MILFIKHIKIEGPETLGTFFEKKGYKIVTVDLFDGGVLPESLADIDAVIPLGGPMNVYEETEYPFLKDEDVFLKKVLAHHIPVLGICLGAQLLSKATGGKVSRSPEKEIGWFTVNFTKEGKVDPLFKGIHDPFEVYQWHGDMCEPPKEATILSSSSRCPVQAFRYGQNAYGLQFHAEITDKSITDWSRALPDAIRDVEYNKMIKRYREIQAAFHEHGNRLCENFLEIMQKK